MAWSEAWKARLSDDQMAPIILVDVGLLSWAAPEFAPTTIGGDTFSSQPHVDGIEPGHLNGSHLVSDLRTNGQSVRLRDWTVNTGGFSFALTSTKPGTAALPFRPTRGLHVQVRMTFDGFVTGGGVEVIQRGMIDQITHDGDTWWVQCRSMLDVLRTRYINTDGGDNDQFFERVGRTTTLRSTWHSNSGNDLPVTASIDFEKDARTGAVGVALVAGSSPARDPWWFVWSGKTGGGTPTLTASGSADWFGNTTVKGYPAGTVVTYYAVAAGKPWNLFGRFVRSTGAESSAGFDTLPRRWGGGLTLSMINTGDITSHTSHPALFDRATGSAISPKWTPFILAPIDNLLEWLQQGLGQFNMWPVQLEDQVSVRMAYDYLYFDPVIVDTIDDDWIVSIDGHDLYHPDADVEYKRVGGSYNADEDLYSLAGNDPISRPWLDRYEKTISAHGLTVDGTDNQPSNLSAWEAGTSEVLADSRTLTTAAHTWYTRLPEYLKLTCRTLRYAPLVPGDLVSITSRHIIGRQGLYVDRICMVTGVTPDWIRGSVVLEFAILPGAKTG